MKQLIGHVLMIVFLAGSVAIAATVQAQVEVRPYTRSDGTPMKGHMRSAPDANPYNNYSYPGNVNPFTANVAGGNPDAYLRDHGGSDEPLHTWPGYQPR